MSYRLVRELAADGVHVAVACRVLHVSSSGYYEWHERPPSARAVADASLRAEIVEIHALSRGRTAPRASTPSCGWVVGCVAGASGWRG